MKWMSLEAVEKVTQSEQKNQERKTAAALEAKGIIATAEQEGLALLNDVRAKADAEGKELLRLAEERAGKRVEEIRDGAEKTAGDLRREAEAHLDEAAQQIVRRVVK